MISNLNREKNTNKNCSITSSTRNIPDSPIKIIFEQINKIDIILAHMAQQK